MSVKLKTLSFNSERQESMLAFYNALGANFQAKQVKAGSNSFCGALGALEIVLYSIPHRDPPSLPMMSLRFEVEKIEPIMAKLRAISEARVMMDIESMPDGKKAIVLDPDGRSVELIEAWASEDQG